MKLGRYRHYKGKEYQVLGVVMHTETNEKLVLYKAFYEIPGSFKSTATIPGSFGRS